MSHLFDELVKVGNNNPNLRDSVSPILHHIRSRSKQATASIDPSKSFYGLRFDWVQTVFEELERMVDIVEAVHEDSATVFHGEDEYTVSMELSLNDNAFDVRIASRENREEFKLGLFTSAKDAAEHIRQKLSYM